MHKAIGMKVRASQDVVQDLARQTQRSIEEAREAYEQELAALEAGARVTLYIPVLARRHARTRLLERR
jgi:hypothetical protein